MAGSSHPGSGKAPRRARKGAARRPPHGRALAHTQGGAAPVAARVLTGDALKVLAVYGSAHAAAEAHADGLHGHARRRLELGDGALELRLVEERHWRERAGQAPVCGGILYGRALGWAAGRGRVAGTVQRSVGGRAEGRWACSNPLGKARSRLCWPRFGNHTNGAVHQIFLYCFSFELPLSSKIRAVVLFQKMA